MFLIDREKWRVVYELLVNVTTWENKSLIKNWASVLFDWRPPSRDRQNGVELGFFEFGAIGSIVVAGEYKGGES
jgi:hypothetical protein